MKFGPEKNNINFQKNKPKDETKTDFEWVEEFYKFLQGVAPDLTKFTRSHQPKMSPKEAMSIIWYLQEHLPVFPGIYERCNNCDRLFDTDFEGTNTGKYIFCGNCVWILDR